MSWNMLFRRARSDNNSLFFCNEKWNTLCQGVHEDVNDHKTEKRCRRLLDHLLHLVSTEEPDVIFLQEVGKGGNIRIANALKGYSCLFMLTGTADGGYGVMTCMKKRTDKRQSFREFQFPGTLIVASETMVFANSHLTMNHWPIYPFVVDHVSTVFETSRILGKGVKYVIHGGDFNTRARSDGFAHDIQREGVPATTVCGPGSYINGGRTTFVDYIDCYEMSTVLARVDGLRNQSPAQRAEWYNEMNCIYGAEFWTTDPDLDDILSYIQYHVDEEKLVEKRADQQMETLFGFLMRRMDPESFEKVLQLLDCYKKVDYTTLIVRSEYFEGNALHGLLRLCKSETEALEKIKSIARRLDAESVKTIYNQVDDRKQTLLHIANMVNQWHRVTEYLLNIPGIDTTIVDNRNQLYTGASLGKAPAATAQQRKTGDWWCQVCKFSIFARKSECSKCGTKKPVY